MRKWTHIGIVGAGTMGGGIAMCFAQAGFRVTLVDQDQEGIDRGLGTIRKNYDITVQRGRLSSDQVARSSATSRRPQTGRP